MLNVFCGDPDTPGNILIKFPYASALSYGFPDLRDDDAERFMTSHLMSQGSLPAITESGFPDLQRLSINGWPAVLYP